MLCRSTKLQTVRVWTCVPIFPRVQSRWLRWSVKIIPTGLYMEIEQGYEGQVRPRSGCAVKQGLTVINAPGTIDADYRGEVGVPLINLSTEPQTIENGDRVAQIVFAPYAKVEEIIEVSDVSEMTDTERGAGGFGHSGKK